MNTLRRPTSEGFLYPSGKDESNKIFNQMIAEINNPIEERDLIGAILPHGNVKNCGRMIIEGLRNIDFNSHRNFLILGTNHKRNNQSSSYSQGISFLIHNEEVKINEELIKKISSNPWLIKDNLSHEQEYSIEYILPYIRFLSHQNFFIVPILSGRQSIEEAKNLSSTIGILRDESFPIISSNLNQFEDRETTENKDNEIIKAMQKLDAEELFKTGKEINHTVCNLSGIGAMLEAARKMDGNIKILNKQTLCYNSYGVERCTGYISAIVFK
ncbi:AmmeMemoRadiSam system protein B [Cuniculiplasma sp. SKW3]|uniref:AmmeMemoRadiSam system protein B n=1 Tax=Cuniculiplasma sp. SKW3 TaxID=3400170 RepID=UPI003FD02D5C